MRPIRLALISLASLLAGCAASGVIVTRLTPPPGQQPLATSGARLVDARERKQLQIEMQSVEGRGTVLLAPVPPVDEALDWHLRVASGRPLAGVTVSIEQLDMSTKVGFAAADTTRCHLVSKLSTAAASGERTVKTDSVNTGNMSPMIATVAQKSLDQCLAEHAAQIAAALRPALTADPTPR